METLKIKRLLEQLQAAEKESSRLDKLWDEDPGNKELEVAWSNAYGDECAAIESLSAEIEKVSKGEIKIKTARNLIYKKRHELDDLITRLM